MIELLKVKKTLIEKQWLGLAELISVQPVG
jgi:hypothetical protein